VDRPPRGKGVLVERSPGPKRSGSDTGRPVSERASRDGARRARREAALAARTSMSPIGPAADRVRVASWNLNSVRVRLPAIERFLGRVQPDILCLQETRTAALSDAARALFDRCGYAVVHVGTGGRNGVAVAAREALEDIQVSGGFADEHLDREPRMASGVVPGTTPVRVASVYVPHGRSVDHWHYEYKLAFLDALANRVRTWLGDGTHVVVAGDVNVAATDSDVFHPDAFVGATHVTPRERAGLARLLDAGLVDVDVARWGPGARRFTWWNHGIGYSRNLGMRLDMIAVDRDLAERLDTTWIDHVEREQTPSSDHAALIADFHVETAAPRGSP
jgi:exodeoxyribonuclease III